MDGELELGLVGPEVMSATSQFHKWEGGVAARMGSAKDVEELEDAKHKYTIPVLPVSVLKPRSPLSRCLELSLSCQPSEYSSPTFYFPWFQLPLVSYGLRILGRKF